MRIGLVDVDGHRYPNLCLMKLSAWHKARGDMVEWWDGLKWYDRVYMSRVFDDTYTQDMDACVQAGEVVRGGTGYGLGDCLPDEVEHCCPDYGLYPAYTQKTAFGFLTRGCPRACPFCIVSKKEGRRSQHVADLSEFWRGQRYIELLDPNLLACPEHLAVLAQLAASKATVNFSQGLDAWLITPENAAMLARIRTRKVHFAFDLMDQEGPILEGLRRYKEATGVPERKAIVYILTNFDTTHEEDLYRVRRVQELGYLPYIMIYNKPAAPPITRKLQRWCNNRVLYFGTGKDFQNFLSGGN